MKKRDVVRVQGSGGVSIAALQVCRLWLTLPFESEMSDNISQFALGAGATVIATTSSEEKASKLKALGASQVLNYKATLDWGERAKKLTPGSRGIDLVVDVGGLSTLSQFVKAVRTGGLIAVTGLLGGDPSTPTPILLDCLTYLCTARGVLLGSVKQFEAMNYFIEEQRIKPVLDQKCFKISQIKEAYTYMTDQRHFSKIGIELC